MPIITAWAALICGIFYLLQTVQTIKARRASGVSIGDGDDKILIRRMRGQANAIEQMPLALIALFLAETLGGSAWILAPFAAIFTVSRIAHGYAFGWLEHNAPLRMYGMIGTLVGNLGILAYLAILVVAAST